jgi:hypothetical protein
LCLKLSDPRINYRGALIKDWRNKWQEGDLPFMYVQLPNYMEVKYHPSESEWAVLRVAQLKTLSVPKTAMAVAIDLGNGTTYIHGPIILMGQIFIIWRAYLLRHFIPMNNSCR